MIWQGKNIDFDGCIGNNRKMVRISNEERKWREIVKFE